MAAYRGRSTWSLVVMRTYPHIREDASVAYFEISNSFPWSLGPMRRVLCSVPGVAGFRKQWFNEYRFIFTFLGRDCLVWEPWGDSSRYWIGPVVKEPPLDMRPVEGAFKRFTFLATFDRDVR